MMQNNQNSNSQKIRYDLRVVAELISANSKVLDIGSGRGELLHFLKNTKKREKVKKKFSRT